MGGKNEDTKKALDEYEKNRTFFENTCNRETKDVLTQYRIYRQAYMSRCFIGPHVMKLMKNSETIMHSIADNLKNNCHREVDQHDIESKYDSVKSILKVLNTISSYTKRTKQLNDEDLDVLRLKIKELGHLWRKHGLPVTPKFHIAECHFVQAMEKYRVLGLFSEEAIERTHHEASVLQGKANNNDFKASQEFVSTRLVMGQSPEVKEVKKKLVGNRKRNFGTVSATKTSQKQSLKEDFKRESYSQPVVDFAEVELPENEL